MQERGGRISENQMSIIIREDGRQMRGARRQKGLLDRTLEQILIGKDSSSSAFVGGDEQINNSVSLV